MPSKPSEFEEKEFEAPLYNQLECGLPNVWAPGQVFEEYLGIDRAAFLAEPRLWRLFGAARPPLGVFMHRMEWEFIWRHRRRRPMPNFRLNLFLQAKRSHYYRRRPNHIRALMPSGPCWRFDIEADQQHALERVAVRVGDRAVVAYAAPVFYRVSELYAHTSRGTIAANSTFPRVESLRNHSSWYYRTPGASGVANADPEQIENPGLLQFLQSIRVDQMPDASGTASEHLGQLTRLIESALEKDVPDENPRKAIYAELVRQIEPIMKAYDESGESSRSFMRVAAFAIAFNLDWYAVG